MPDAKYERFWAALRGEPDPDALLGRLLDDVRRMADGIGSIHDLAVSITREPQRPAPAEAFARGVRCLTSLRERVNTARAVGSKDIDVNLDELEALMNVVERRGVWR